MYRIIVPICLALFGIPLLSAQVTLDADGSTDTYSLITSVLAPGSNPIEVPDCGHGSFGDHIDQVFDDELNAYAFRFHIHTDQDNDRCISFDRQRNEIKSFSASPDNLLGIEGETVVYKWKFKLSNGFQSSPNFTHLHQLKSVGGNLESMPIITLTTRKSNPDRIELRYAETTSQVTLRQTPLSPFIGKWIEVVETVTYGFQGAYNIQIMDVASGSTLLSYTNDNIILWRPGADFVRPKWGIYRSLLNDQDLKDETLLYANFSVEEITPVSTNDPDLQNQLVIFQDPLNQTIHLQNIPSKGERIQLFSSTGALVQTLAIYQYDAMKIAVADLSSGIYVIRISGKNINQSSLIVISR